MNATGEWIAVPPNETSFVINIGNAYEAATKGAVEATVHRVTVSTRLQPCLLMV